MTFADVRRRTAKSSRGELARAALKNSGSFDTM